MLAKLHLYIGSELQMSQEQSMPTCWWVFPDPEIRPSSLTHSVKLRDPDTMLPAENYITISSGDMFGRQLNYFTKAVIK